MKRIFTASSPWLLSCLFLSAASLASSAANPDGVEEKTTTPYEWRIFGAMQYDLHIYDNGFRDGEPEFISRYTPLRTYYGDDYPGYYVDLTRLRIDLVNQETGRTLFGLDRTSFAYFNQHNSIFYDPELIRLDIRYSLYRSQQMKPDNRPDPAGGNSIFARFNDDSFGQTDFFVRRSDLDAGLKLRPSLFGHDGSQLGDVDLSYHRSDRASRRYFDYVLTARLAGGANQHHARWRGIDQRVIEGVNRGGVALSATPFQQVLVSYEVYVEKYDRSFNNSTLADVARIANVPVYSPPRPTEGLPGFMDPALTDFWPLGQVTLGWAPSSTKLVNKIKLQREIGPGTLSAGYANVFLDADEFTAFALDRGFDRSQIITHSAFGNWSMPLGAAIRWNTHANYRLRDNRSRFPALDPQNRPPHVDGASVFDYMNPLLDGGKHGAVFAPFIKELHTFKLGTDFTFILPFASSRVHAGYEYEDIYRDLIFGDPPPGLVRSIDPHEAFVRPDSNNHTFFLNYSARPVKNLRFRWHNAFKYGDRVAMVTEPETGVKSRIGLGYVLPNALRGATFDVFYQVRYDQTGGFGITSLDETGALLDYGEQDREKLFQSAGLTFTIMPSEKWTAYTGYLWNRDSLEANFMRTTARRYDATWLFSAITPSRYVTDAHTLFIGNSYAFTARWVGTLDYTVTAIDGRLGTGQVEAILGRDNQLDNFTHHLSTGLNYQVNRNWNIGGRYAYAVYHDRVDRRLNSGFHVIGLLASLSF
jgi:hypothetical protein